MIFKTLNFGRWGSGGTLKATRLLAIACGLFAVFSPAQSAPLLEEGFNYAAGSNLAANAPWAGSSGASVSLVSGNLTYTNLRSTVPAGNMLQITGGTTRNVYRYFSTTAVAGGAVYCSMLLRCSVPPTNSQLIACLLSAGKTSPNNDTDPLELNVTAVTNGCRLSIVAAGSDSASIRQTLLTNTTHLIVVKYIFSANGQGSIYLDPTPGSVEPSSATATTSGGDGGAGATNLQTILFRSSSSVGQGGFTFDAVRVSTNWADVTPLPNILSLAGPTDQAVCYGSSANFGVVVTGTPPIMYHWRTNGVVITSATNSTFTLTTPTANDTLKNFDVVVTDIFGAVTSRIARLTFSTNAASIVTQPVGQLVTPGLASATFNVTAAGDAPLSFQWRANGMPIPGATSPSYVLNNPGPADVATALDCIVSNPCGSITSSPPVGVYFPNIFYAGYDAGAGFFGGENIIFTNISAQSYYVWSSPDLATSVTNWTLEGQMSELPLGTTGQSRYGINLNPTTSPVYYIIAQRNSGPYTDTEPLFWLTSDDYASFTLTSSNLTISAAGIFNQNTFYTAYDAGAGFFGGENLIFTNTSGTIYCAWSSPDLSVSVTNWTFEGPMSELPLGTTGESRYGINLNPVTSPVYYIFAQTNTGNYTPTEALVWLTTEDYASFTVINSNAPITTDGIFAARTATSVPNAFYPAYDAGAGFFSGENLVLAAASATNFYVWSSTDPSISVTNWTFEGAMSEFPFGNSGDSNYGINLNPIASPVYYIFAQTNSGPYTVTEPVIWLTTFDFASYTVNNSNVAINAAGILALPALPNITQPPQSQTVLTGQNPSFSVLAAGSGLGYRWLFNNNSIPGASTPFLNLTNVSLSNAGSYVVIVTNLAGAEIRSGATLNVVVPPTLNFGSSSPGSLQLSANCITGATYAVEAATNLFHPVWVPVFTGNTGIGGVVNFQTNATARASQFYRLVFP